MSEQQNQISKLAGALTEHQRHFGDMPSDDRQWVIQNTKSAIALFVEAVKNRNNGQTAPVLDMDGTFRLTVDYGQSLDEMIAAGRYDWKNSDITAKRFPIEGKGIVEFDARYFHFNRSISSEDAIAAMKEAGWEPAKIEHVLSHGKTFPEEQRKFPIVGLGSAAEVSGDRYVPFLYGDVSERRLGLHWWDGVWFPDCRFLAVRKVSAA